MKLSQVLKDVKVKNEYKDVEVKDVTADSRQVEEGNLFVCIKGASFDGHSVAEEMLKKGAAAVVCDHDLGLANQVIVDDTRKAYSPICASFFGNPANSLKLIGLTGTNGKTTTTFLIKQILENVGKKCGLIGTVQNMVGSEVYPAHYTTPDPHELQSLFRKMVDANCEYCIMEVSSQALAQGRVEGIHFHIGAFTNLTQDHLDYHKTWENYFEAKKLLFKACDTAVTNVDNKYGLKIVEGCNCKTVTYGVDNMKADYTARNVRFSSQGVKYDLIGEKIGRVDCPIPGRFSVYNSLCAISVALTLGVDFTDVLEAISKSNGVKGRIEVVPTPNQDYTVRDKTKRPKMVKIAADLSDFCVVTSDNPRSENPSDIIKDILEGMKDSKTPYEVVENRKEAIAWAMKNAKKDDIILLAGKGHETYQILPTGTIHFDEREVVAEVLEELNK